MQKQVKLGPMAGRYFKAERALSDELFAKAEQIRADAEARFMEALSVLGSEVGELIPPGARYNFGADGSLTFEWPVPAPQPETKARPCDCHDKGEAAESAPEAELLEAADMATEA